MLSPAQRENLVEAPRIELGSKAVVPKVSTSVSFHTFLGAGFSRRHRYPVAQFG